MDDALQDVVGLDCTWALFRNEADERLRSFLSLGVNTVVLILLAGVVPHEKVGFGEPIHFALIFNQLVARGLLGVRLLHIFLFDVLVDVFMLIFDNLNFLNHFLGRASEGIQRALFGYLQRLGGLLRQGLFLEEAVLARILLLIQFLVLGRLWLLLTFAGGDHLFLDVGDVGSQLLVAFRSGADLREFLDDSVFLIVTAADQVDGLEALAPLQGHQLDLVPTLHGLLVVVEVAVIARGRRGLGLGRPLVGNSAILEVVQDLQVVEIILVDFAAAGLLRKILQRPLGLIVQTILHLVYHEQLLLLRRRTRIDFQKLEVTFEQLFVNVVLQGSADIVWKIISSYN